MQKTEKFFIFSWKELVVIALLVLTSLGFFFTLGLHYGKKIHGEPAQTAEVPSEKLEASPEAVPPKTTLEQGSEHAETATKDAIQTATQNAVKENDVKVDQPKPVDLPKEKAAEAPVEVKKEEPAAAAPEAAPKEARYAVQLGSYPSRKEAQLKIGTLNKRGLKPEIMVAQVNGETRYRVILSGFKTKQLAMKKGKDLHTSRKIESYVIIKED